MERRAKNTKRREKKDKDFESKRQIFLIALCVLAYAVSYVSRSSYTSNIGVITAKYSLTQAQTGLVSSFYFFAYGIGQVVNGLLCKKYNKKYCIALSLSVSAVINAILFFSPAFFLYKWLWMLNGFALSVLWSSLVSILSKNLDDRHLSAGIFCMSMSLALGTFVSYGSSAILNIFEGYRYAFLIAFVMASCVAVLWLCRYDALTLSPDASVVAKEAEQTPRKEGAKAAKKALASSVFLFGGIGLFGAIGSLLKDGLHTWVPTILKTSFGYTDSLSIALSLVLPVVGMFGSRISLFLSKRIKDFFMILFLLFVLITACVVVVKFSIGGSGVFAGVVTVGVFGVIYLFCYTVNNFVTSVVPMRLRDSYDSGLLAGILNGCAYVGSTISAYALGAFADRFGWNGVFTLFVWIAVAASLFSIGCVVFGALRRNFRLKRGEEEIAVKTENGEAVKKEEN